VTKGAKIAVACFAGMLAFGLAPLLLGSLRATRDHSKVSVDMSARDVFNVVEGWNLCISSYLDESTKEFGAFTLHKEPSQPAYFLPLKGHTARIDSKEELFQLLETRMRNGKAWNSPFTYFAGPIPHNFRVDFDQNGKVINISGMGGGP
jgi:hypothetical protein